MGNDVPTSYSNGFVLVLVFVRLNTCSAKSAEREALKREGEREQRITSEGREWCSYNIH